MHMTEREALKLALDYIIATNKSSHFWLVPESNLNKTVNAIKEALAQTEQERTGSCPLDDCDGGPKTHGCWAHHCEWKAQPEQEPVAVYVSETWCGSVVRLYEDLPLETPLYTTPPQHVLMAKHWKEEYDKLKAQRTWVELTDEEEFELDQKYGHDFNLYIDQRDMKLKEKNL